MALIKNVELKNGVVLNYHRVASLNKITNMSNIIEVNSYVNKIQRLKEKEYQQLQIKSQNNEITDEEKEQLDNGINVLIETDYIELPYNATMEIEDAYEYLKTLDKYKNSQDDIEV